MSTSIPISWRWRRWLWTRWHLLRFRLNKPQKIGVPPSQTGRLTIVPIERLYPTIPLRNVLAVEKMPTDEASLGMRILVNAGLALNRWVSPMCPGLREIDADVERALADAGIEKYAKALRAPVRPLAYGEPAASGVPDLARLAVESPYAVFLERGSDGGLQWDLRRLADFEHHEGLCSLGVRVVFSEEARSTALTATRIESTELGVVAPGDTEWQRAAMLAMCAAGTHLSLSRHFAAVHLVSGDHWDVATRNQLPTDHALYRLLWPHIFNSFYTNYGVTRTQLLPDGDFVNMFSFTHAGLTAYFDEVYRTYDIAVTDPVADWSRRGLDGTRFEAPTQGNLTELFDVMHAHALRYLDAYYESDDQLRADNAVGRWLGELATLIPNGVGDVADAPTKSGMARLIGGYMYEGSTMHDMVGTTLWDYQLWADRSPTRVYRDGRRVPIDVFQRVINNNFALQIRRAPLLADYGQVALDERGAAMFAQFHEECSALQAQYDTTPAGPWRMEPRNLEINMNG